MIDISIEAMQIQHLDAVVEIEAQVQPFPWTHGNFSDCIDSAYQAYVAIYKQKVIGYYVMVLNPDVAHLVLVSICPKYQNMGIGKIMINHCHNTAMAHNQDRVILETRASNQRAMHFYQQLGYDCIAVKPGYYPTEDGLNEDAHIFEKTLC